MALLPILMGKSQGKLKVISSLAQTSCDTLTVKEKKEEDNYE